MEEQVDLDIEEMQDVPSDAAARREIRQYLQYVVKQQTGQRISQDVAHAIFEAAITVALYTTVMQGYLRLPQGWGAFKLRWIGNTGVSKERRTPLGKVVPRKPTPRVRYLQGAAIRELTMPAGRPSQYQRQTKRKWPVVPTAEE